MANGNESAAAQQKNHIRFIIICVTWLGTLAIGCGTVLIYKGYATGGELLVANGGIGAITGLIGFLSAGRPPPPPQDVTVSTAPPKVELKAPVPAAKTETEKNAAVAGS